MSTPEPGHVVGLVGGVGLLHPPCHTEDREWGRVGPQTERQVQVRVRKRPGVGSGLQRTRAFRGPPCPCGHSQLLMVAFLALGRKPVGFCL